MPLLSLPAEKKEQIAEWLIQSEPYHAVLEKLQATAGITATLEDVDAFWEGYCLPRLARLHQRAQDLCAQILPPSENPGAHSLDALAIALAQQRIVELALQSRPSEETAGLLARYVLKRGDQALAAERLAVMRRCLELREARSPAAREGRTGLARDQLTQQELQIIVDNVDQILGIT